MSAHWFSVNHVPTGLGMMIHSASHNLGTHANPLMTNHSGHK